MQFKLLKNKEKTKENSALKNKKIQEKSRGRSMVEMLGILAIIGVLSIGGIAGYTMAMRRYRANEILAALQKYATVLYTSCLSSQQNDEYETVNLRLYGGVKEVLICPHPIGFLESGLGGLPTGMKKVGFVFGAGGQFASDDELNNFGYYYSNTNKIMIRTQSGDIVRLYVTVDSKELCETILTLSGTIADKRDGSGERGMCEGGGSYGYEGLVSFIMN